MKLVLWTRTLADMATDLPFLEADQTGSWSAIILLTGGLQLRQPHNPRGNSGNCSPAYQELALVLAVLARLACQRPEHMPEHKH